MNFEEKIGLRLKNCRKKKQMSALQLAAKTGFNRQSIARWEKGERLIDIKSAQILAEYLEVSPIYLAGLSGNPEGECANLAINIPLIPLQSLPADKNTLETFVENYHAANPEQQITDSEVTATGKYPLFSVRMEDKALAPTLQPDDILIIDPNQEAMPGNYVLASHKNQNMPRLIIRQYREGKTREGGFELVASNPDWRNIEIDNPKDTVILGTVIGFRHYFLS
nr:repressor [Coxiellaceae bacterium]